MEVELLEMSMGGGIVGDTYGGRVERNTVGRGDKTAGTVLLTTS